MDCRYIQFGENRFVFKGGFESRISQSSYQEKKSKGIELPEGVLEEDAPKISKESFEERRKNEIKKSKEFLSQKFDLDAGSPDSLKSFLMKTCQTEYFEAEKVQNDELQSHASSFGGYNEKSSLELVDNEFINEAEIDSKIYAPYKKALSSLDSYSGRLPSGVVENLKGDFSDAIVQKIWDLSTDAPKWAMNDVGALNRLLNSISNVVEQSMTVSVNRLDVISKKYELIKKYNIPEGDLAAVFSKMAVNRTKPLSFENLDALLKSFSSRDDINSFVSSNKGFSEELLNLLDGIAEGSPSLLFEARRKIDVFLNIPLNSTQIIDSVDGDLQKFIVDNGKVFSDEKLFVYWTEFAAKSNLWNLTKGESESLYLDYLKIQVLDSDSKEKELKVFDKRSYALNVYSKRRKGLENDLVGFKKNILESKDMASSLLYSVKLDEIDLELAKNEVFLATVEGYFADKDLRENIDDLSYGNIDKLLESGFLDAEKFVLPSKKVLFELVHFSEKKLERTNQVYNKYLLENGAEAKLGVVDEGGRKTGKEAFSEYYQELELEALEFNFEQKADIEGRIDEIFAEIDAYKANPSGFSQEDKAYMEARIQILPLLLDQARGINAGLTGDLMRVGANASKHGVDGYFSHENGNFYFSQEKGDDLTFGAYAKGLQEDDEYLKTKMQFLGLTDEIVEKIYPNSYYQELVAEEFSDESELMGDSVVHFANSASEVRGIWGKVATYQKFAGLGPIRASMEAGGTLFEIFADGEGKYESFLSDAEQGRTDLISTQKELLASVNPSDPVEKARLDALYEANPGFKETRERMIEVVLDQLDVLLLEDGPFSEKTIGIYREQYEALKNQHENVDAEFYCQQFQMAVIVLVSVGTAMATAGLSTVALSGLGISGYAAMGIQMTAVAASTTLIGQPAGMLLSQGIGMAVGDFIGNDKLANMMSYEDYDAYFETGNLARSFAINLLMSVGGAGIGGAVSKGLAKYSNTAFNKAIMAEGVKGGLKGGLSHLGREFVEEMIEENSGQMAEKTALDAGYSPEAAQIMGLFVELMVGGVTTVNVDSNAALKAAGIDTSKVNITASNGQFKYVGSPDALALQLKQSFGADATVERMADGRIVVDYLTGVTPDGKSKVPKSVVAALGGKMEIFSDRSPAGLLARFGGRGIERDGESGELKLTDFGILRVLKDEGVGVLNFGNGEIVLMGFASEDIVLFVDDVANGNVDSIKTEFLKKHSDNPELIKAFMDLQRQFKEASSEFIAWYEGSADIFASDYKTLKELALLPKSMRVQFKNEVLDIYKVKPELLAYFLELSSPFQDRKFPRFMKLKDVYLKNYDYVRANVEFFVNFDLVNYLASDPSRFDEVRGKYERNKALIENFNREDFLAEDVSLNEKLNVEPYIIQLDNGVRTIKLFGQYEVSLEFSEDGVVKLFGPLSSDVNEGEVIYVKHNNFGFLDNKISFDQYNVSFLYKKLSGGRVAILPLSDDADFRISEDKKSDSEQKKDYDEYMAQDKLVNLLGAKIPGVSLSGQGLNMNRFEVSDIDTYNRILLGESDGVKFKVERYDDSLTVRSVLTGSKGERSIEIVLSPKLKLEMKWGIDGENVFADGDSYYCSDRKSWNKLVEDSKAKGYKVEKVGFADLGKEIDGAARVEIKDDAALWLRITNEEGESLFIGRRFEYKEAELSFEQRENMARVLDAFDRVDKEAVKTLAAGDLMLQITERVEGLSQSQMDLIEEQIIIFKSRLRSVDEFGTFSKEKQMAWLNQNVFGRSLPPVSSTEYERLQKNINIYAGDSPFNSKSTYLYVEMSEADYRKYSDRTENKSEYSGGMHVNLNGPDKGGIAGVIVTYKGYGDEELLSTMSHEYDHHKNALLGVTTFAESKYREDVSNAEKDGDYESMIDSVYLKFNERSKNEVLAYGIGQGESSGTIVEILKKDLYFGKLVGKYREKYKGLSETDPERYKSLEAKFEAKKEEFFRNLAENLKSWDEIKAYEDAFEEHGIPYDGMLRFSPVSEWGVVKDRLIAQLEAAPDLSPEQLLAVRQKIFEGRMAFAENMVKGVDLVMKDKIINAVSQLLKGATVQLWRNIRIAVLKIVDRAKSFKENFDFAKTFDEVFAGLMEAKGVDEGVAMPVVNRKSMRIDEVPFEREKYLSSMGVDEVVDVAERENMSVDRVEREGAGISEVISSKTHVFGSTSVEVFSIENKQTGKLESKIKIMPTMAYNDISPTVDANNTLLVPAGAEEKVVKFVKSITEGQGYTNQSYIDVKNYIYNMESGLFVKEDYSNFLIEESVNGRKVFLFWEPERGDFAFEVSGLKDKFGGYVSFPMRGNKRKALKKFEIAKKIIEESKNDEELLEKLYFDDFDVESPSEVIVGKTFIEMSTSENRETGKKETRIYIRSSLEDANVSDLADANNSLLVPEGLEDELMKKAKYFAEDYDCDGVFLNVKRRIAQLEGARIKKMNYKDFAMEETVNERKIDLYWSESDMEFFLEVRGLKNEWGEPVLFKFGDDKEIALQKLNFAKKIIEDSKDDNSIINGIYGFR